MDSHRHGREREVKEERRELLTLYVEQALERLSRIQKLHNSMVFDRELLAYKIHKATADELVHRAIMDSARVESLSREAINQADMARQESAQFYKIANNSPFLPGTMPAFWHRPDGVKERFLYDPDKIWSFGKLTLPKLETVASRSFSLPCLVLLPLIQQYSNFL